MQPLSLLHQGLPAISSCHTDAQQLFWKIALHLLKPDAQTFADPGEVAASPGRCLQVLEKKSAASQDAPIHPEAQTAVERKGCAHPLALYGGSAS